MSESEFYSPKPQSHTDPEADPPMTVRVRVWANRFKPDAHRAIKIDGKRSDGYVWLAVSGEYSRSLVVLNHDDVRTWPVVHPLTYTTAFRHAEHQRAAEEGLRRLRDNLAASVGFGDMDVEAFRGAPD